MASMSLQVVYDQARQALESNDLERAIGLAQHILDHYPDNLEAYRILGEAYLANRQLDRAQESFERVLLSDPENIPAHVGLGITSERQGQLDRAINEFEQALEIKPDMTELRSQLLRLYTEGWGSENAQLRLSRAGLARLYAKGHMLPQAIAEFRQVLADQPSRHDAMVALAEALWRDGQEEEAIDLCRDILSARPESLKANLLLGYLQLSSGRSEGERYWQAAQRMDPYNAVARALFETLPHDNGEEPAIEAWDEAAWQARRAAEQQEQLAATRPMEPVTPVGTSAFGDFFDTPAERPVAAGAASSRSETFTDADDFLASLLSMDMPTTPPPIPPVDLTEEDLDLDMRSFDSHEPSSSSAAQEPASAPAPEPSPAPAPESSPGDTPTMTPFSLSDLGLSDEEIASVESASAAQPANQEPAMTPFSLSDLGLSDEEIAGLQSIGAEPQQAAEPQSPAAPSQSQSETEDFGDLNDLPVDLKPFSIDELDLGGDQRPGSMSLPPSLQPFSLDEQPPPQRPRVSGFSAPETSESESAAEDEDVIPESRGFSWQQASQKPQTEFGKPARADAPAEESSIFAKLKQQRVSQGETPPPPLPPVSLSEGEHLGLFSVDDVPLRDDAEAAKSQPAEPPAPASSARESVPPQEIEDLQSAVESGQVQPFSLADLGLSPEEIAALEGAGLSEQPTAQAAEPPAPASPARESVAPQEIEDLQSAVESGQVQPFSLADLGLSPEEIAALEGAGLSEQPAAQAAEPPAPPAEPPAASPAPHEIEDLQSAVESGQVQPFSLADLGLSPEEIAALESAGLAEQPAAQEAPEVTPPTMPPPAPSAGEEEPLTISELTPFSLADLGLSDEEIGALGLGGAEAEEEEGVGLGLTEEELEGLDGGDLKWLQPSSSSTPAPEPEAAGGEPLQVTSGDLVVDRLIALGRQQGYVDISDIIANVDDPEAETERIEEIGQRLHEARIEIRDGDEVVDMDADETEEERASEPAETAAEPEDLDVRPAFTRDLDLMTAELEVPKLDQSTPESVRPSEPTPPREPDMTPFSLKDLGLTDEEINSLGLSDVSAPAEAPAPAAEETRPDEPDMTPFSLSELGLSDDEIAALGLGDMPAPSQAPAPEADAGETKADEPDMTPFSLSELGLSDDEIAALGLGEASSAPPAQSASTSGPAQSDEADMTPFSLNELGLSDDEIAAFGLDVEPEAPEHGTSEAGTAAEAERPELQEPPPAAELPAPAEAQAPAQPEPPSPPEPPAPPAPAARPAAPPPSVPSGTGNELLDAFVRRLEADPENDVLRLSVARVSGQVGRIDLAVTQYKYLIKHNRLLSDIAQELQELIEYHDNRQDLQRLHRLLGDVYSKQGRLQEAIDEYSWRD